MPEVYNFEIFIRKMRYTDLEDLYRITVFTRLENMDDLLLHGQVAPLIENTVFRLEKIDNFRFKLFVQKVPPAGPAR